MMMLMIIINDNQNKDFDEYDDGYDRCIYVYIIILC